MTTNSSDVVFGLSLDARFWDRGPATVIVQPQGQRVMPGSNVLFRAVAVGEEPLNYQWQKEGVNLVQDERVQGVTEQAPITAPTWRWTRKVRPT